MIERSKCLSCGKATKGQFWCGECQREAIRPNRLRIERQLAVLVRHLNLDSIKLLIEHAKDEIRETTTLQEPFDI